MTRRHFCVRCAQISSILLSAKYLGSTMHICFLLSQIASCSKSWCYSYTRNSKRPLDQLLTVKNKTSQEYRENYKTTQQTIWRSNENVRGKTCFFNLVISTSFPVIAHKCWHWENKTNKTLYCCFIGVLVALQYVRFSQPLWQVQKAYAQRSLHKTAVAHGRNRRTGQSLSDIIHAILQSWHYDSLRLALPCFYHFHCCSSTLSNMSF